MTDTVSTPPEPPPDGSGRSAPPKSATLRQIVGAVLWSLFGVRKDGAMRRDVVTIKPHQVIIVGVLIVAALVGGLLILVRVITRSL